MKPAWHDNFLICYDALLKRLADVPGVAKVIEARNMGELGDGRKIVPLDNVVYVILDAMTPTTSNGGGREQTVEIGFSLILVKRDYTPSRVPYRAAGVGETWTAITRAIQGFDPQDTEGRALTASPFVQRAALPIDYRDGHALFPLRFVTTVASLGDAN